MKPFALIIFSSFFFLLWTLYLICERFLNMQPEFYTSNDLKEKDADLSSGEKTIVIHQQSTKSSDARGEYRIRIRPQIHYLKGFAMFVLAAVAIWPIVASGSFEIYDRLFFQMDATAISTIYVQTAAAILLAWYFFEIIILLQYHKLDWSNILHHWVTSFAAILVLLEVYLPAAILYGMFMVALTFPVFLLMGFRAHKGNVFADLTRKMHRWASVYYAMLLVVCISLQLGLLWNGLEKGVHGYGYALLILLCCIAWCYDDIQLIKALRKAAKRPYELLQFDTGKSKS